MSRVYLDKDGHYTSWPVRWYDNKKVMNKLLSLLCALGVFILLEVLLYCFVSIGDRTFSYVKWSTSAGGIFTGCSLLMLFALAIISTLILIGEIKPKK